MSKKTKKQRKEQEQDFIHKNQSTASNAFDNPFKSIDKNQFKYDLNISSQQVKKPLKEEKPLPTNEFENEDDYFLYAMGSVHGIKSSDKYMQKDNEVSTKKAARKPVKASYPLNDYDKKTNIVKKQEKEGQALFSSQELKHIKKKQEIAHNLQHKLNENTPTHNKKRENEHNLEISPQKKPEDNENYDFFSAVKDVKPLAGKKYVAPPEPEKIIVQNDSSPMLYDFEEGKIEFSCTMNDSYVQCNILGLDLMILAQLQNRHYNPEAHLDLHGLTIVQAYHSLVGFFKNAYYRDMRCILLVTGKGMNSFDNKAVIRTKVTEWLIQRPFKYSVLAFCSAKQEDGGTGALYVLLRKRRRNAPEIPWDKMPYDNDLWYHLEK